METHKKHLIFFDFDNTVADGDTYHLQLKLLKNAEEEEYLHQTTLIDDWINCFNAFYAKLKEKNITIEQFEDKMRETQFVSGMKELFDYLRKEKNKYEICIISASNTFCINFITKHFNIRDLIDHLICNIAEVDKEGKIVVQHGPPHDCKTCNPSQCKSKSLKEFLQTHPRDSYKKIIFVADGGNDFCMSSRLEENDLVCPRKDFKLFQKIFNEGGKSKLKCAIEPWASADELIKVFEEMDKK